MADTHRVSRLSNSFVRSLNFKLSATNSAGLVSIHPLSPIFPGHTLCSMFNLNFKMINYSAVVVVQIIKMQSSPN